MKVFAIAGQLNKLTLMDIGVSFILPSATKKIPQCQSFNATFLRGKRCYKLKVGIITFFLKCYKKKAIYKR